MEVNFKSEIIRIDLVNPIFILPHGAKSESERETIEAVELRRLDSLDLMKLQSVMGRVIPGRESSMILVAKEFLDLAITGFFSGGKPYTKVTNPLLIKRLPSSSVYQLFLFTIMHIKETSLVSTNYRCTSCNGTNMFDLDPESPIPPDIEKERALMEDFLTFYSERKNRTNSYFEYTLKNPIYLDPAEEDSEPEAEGEEEGGKGGKKKKEPVKITLMKLRFRWPELMDYLTSANDVHRSAYYEAWALYDSITGINDLTEAQTKAVKEKNGFEKLFRKLKIVDVNGITDAMGKYGVDIKHHFTCVHCAYENKVPFDYTNFFAFQRS